MRIGTKAAKKADPAIAGMDSVLKWMLVTCFGYTGYKNAKFGRVDVHEAITRISREALIVVEGDGRATAGSGCSTGSRTASSCRASRSTALKAAIEAESGYLMEVETFDWVVFLPQKDGTGAYTWYYGRLDDGEVKVRGIMARRGDCPAYVQRFQQEALALMGTARSIAELRAVADGGRGRCTGGTATGSRRPRSRTWWSPPDQRRWTTRGGARSGARSRPTAGPACTWRRG